MTDTLVHDALIYDSDKEFLDWIGPFVVEGLENGEEIMVVSHPRNCDLLREALGANASEVVFADARDTYRKPVATIAEYHGIVDRVRAEGQTRLRLVGEVEFGTTDIEHARWTRYESVLNAVFESQPAWIVCPYDTRRLPEQVIHDARHTHPNTIRSRKRRQSDVYEIPANFAIPLPLPAIGRLLGELDVNGSLRPVREMVTRTAQESGLKDERAEEMCLVVNEITTNALRHGRPPVSVRAWSNHSAVVFEITDNGSGPTDSLVGFIPPAPDQVDGRGLWVSRQLADRLEISTDSRGTSVRASASRSR